MLISQFRKGEQVDTKFGARNNKELFFSELSEEEQHKAIFQALLQNFYVIETDRQTLLQVWRNIQNIRGHYGAKLRKVWRHQNHQNYSAQLKIERHFEEYHQGNTTELEKIMIDNYCTFNAKNGGYVTVFKHHNNGATLPRMLKEFAL